MSNKSNPVPQDTTYMNYFRLDNHDAQCLTIGDRVPRNGRLSTVVEHSRKRSGETVIKYDDGFSFDPSDNNPNFRSMTFYRPRRAFSASPILPRGKKSEHGLDTLKKDTTKKSRSDRKTSGSRK